MLLALAPASLAPALLAAQTPGTVPAAAARATGDGGHSEGQAPASRLVFLGTGTPNADPERWGPALAVVVGDQAYLVDAGPGIVRRAAAAARKGIPALQPPRLVRVFLTHLHSDHTLGLPDLMLSPWVLGRDRPLEVFGPEGTRDMTRHILQAYRADIDMRRYGLEPANDSGYRVIVHEIAPGVVYHDGHVTVTAFPVLHGSWPQAFGYRFDTPDRSIVISGDTRPTDAVVRACNGCDILVHEVYSADRFRQRSPAWQRYHAAFHTSTTELAALATRAHPGLLILDHVLFWGATPADIVAEIRRAGYSGRVVLANDLDVF
jgi:ribonuclease BN (tRNA processing enzyme)